jgi:hypothetical protein
MRRRSKASGEPAKTRRLKTVTLKRGNAPKAVHSRSPSIADLQEQLDRRTRERDEALEQQAATAEVLKALSRSTFDLHSVLNSLLVKAVRRPANWSLCSRPCWRMRRGFAAQILAI